MDVVPVIHGVITRSSSKAIVLVSNSMNAITIITSTY
jgi:hypothetical protein